MNEYAKTTLMVYMMLEQAMDQLGDRAKPIQIKEEDLELKIMAWKKYGNHPHNVEIITTMDPAGMGKTMRARLNKQKQPQGRNKYIDLE